MLVVFLKILEAKIHIISQFSTGKLAKVVLISNIYHGIQNDIKIFMICLFMYMFI